MGCAAGIAVLAWICLLSSHACMASPLDSPDSIQGTQAISPTDTGPLRNYGRQVSESWLKNTLGVDLEAMQIVWDPETESFTTAGDIATRPKVPGETPTAGTLTNPIPPALARGVTFQLTQTDDLTHLSEGVRDVPFGLEVKGVLRLMRSLSAMDARLKVPLSPNDEWRADLSMPLDLMGATRSAWWRGLGLGKSLSLRSDATSRLGLNQLEAGLDTKWDPGLIGRWNLDYDWQVRHGQGTDETSQWLKLSKEF